MSVERSRLIQAARLLAGNADLTTDAEIAAVLFAEGFSIDESYRLIALLPMALARPVLEELGIIPAPDVAILTGDRGGVRVALADQPEYVAALSLARDHRQFGAMPHDLFVKIAGGSADTLIAHDICEAGEDPRGHVIACCFHNPEMADHMIGPLRPVELEQKLPPLRPRRAGRVSGRSRSAWRG
jgi:hypothetical protein